jgi:hypothetical protein
MPAANGAAGRDFECARRDAQGILAKWLCASASWFGVRSMKLLS